MTDANDLQISRNYKLFKQVEYSCWGQIYKLVEIISYSNQFNSKKLITSTN